MSLLIGTDDGVYRVDDVPFEVDDAERTLDCGMVTELRTPDHADAVYVGSTEGAYRSTDGGLTWEDLEVPLGERYWYAGQSQVWAVLPSPDGTIWAGTNDPYLYRSYDDGDTWTEVRSFRELPTRGYWESPVDPHYVRLRSIEVVPNDPDHVIVAVEAGGMHVSTDGGRSWTDKRELSPTDDIHQVLPMDDKVYLAACGHLDHHLEHLGMGHAVGVGGVHRTVDGGDSWTRLDVANDYDYVRRVFVHDGTLFFCGATEAPPAWVHDDHEAALFESTDFGRSFDRVDYPGEPYEVIETWDVLDDQVICGSGLVDVPEPRDDVEGRVMIREDGPSYETLGHVPANIYGLVAV